VAIVLGLEIYLARSYRDAFAPMLQAIVQPRVAREKPVRVPASALDAAE
jgi:hypothetical protein